MTLETVVMLIAFIVFGICTLLFINRASAASKFRSKIAMPRNFVEGTATGIAYPLWGISYGLIFLQCAAFMAFPPAGELALNDRLIIYILSVFVFFVLRACNLPLLAIWFGKTGVWISHGTNGLIKFEDMLSCTVIRRRNRRSVNSNVVCTLVFYARNRFLFFYRRRFVCKLSAFELEPYLKYLPTAERRLSGRDKLHARDAFISFFSCICAVFAMFGSACFLFSSAVLSPYTYTESESALSEEIATFAPITEALESDNCIILRHEAIEAINVYSESDGQLLWSVSRYKHAFPRSGDGISATDGILRYTVNGSDRYFDVKSGKELSAEEVSDKQFPAPNELRDINFEFHPLYVRKQLSDGSYRYIVNHPMAYVLFVPSVAWGILLAASIALYLLRAIASRRADAAVAVEAVFHTPTVLSNGEETENHGEENAKNEEDGDYHPKDTQIKAI
ncbi:MAG: hypothetical protein IKB34_02145 [Clostridia bacterium]|nr:hypothetical protein [Clostridia bacterium]